jgi:hypothetical protein
VSRSRVSVAQKRVLGLSLSRKVTGNLCLKISRYEDMGMLRIQVTDRLIV